ncbi:hypothetical protein LRAMOSA02150 [Lichtheimia ramosa]|uniref:Uncharacterized protein n=1 Tax=Lichtheimia ramosa TaxID=688394 RepID=A0A077WN52_9FUNG|nr:hypothetical protein LRAMOSA02150 [Lichtheimia ramosa]
MASKNDIDFPSKDPYRMRPAAAAIGDRREPSSIYTDHQEDMEKRANSYLPYSNHAPELRPVELYIDESEHPTTTATQHPHVRLDLYNAEGASKSMLSAPALSLIKALATHPTHQHHDNTTTTKSALGNPPLSSIELVQRRRQKRQRCTRRMYILCWITALVLAAVGIIIFFCWPRTPGVAMADKAQSIYLPADWGPDHQPSLRATWQLNVTLDNTQNWIPTRVHGIDFTLVDDATGVTFATGRQEPAGLIILPPRAMHPLRVVLHVSYEPPSINDTTFQDLYNACGPKKMGAASDLDVHLQASFHIWGLAWKPTAVAQPESDTFACPTN